MNIVFFAVGHEHAWLAEQAAQAARITNPDARLWVITDQTTEFDTLEPFRIWTSVPTLMYDRTIGQLHFLQKHGEALFLDSDCAVSKPLEGAFAGDVCVTSRVTPTALREQPYNGGVLYGRGAAAIKFWSDFVRMYQYLERTHWHWWGDQMVLACIVPQYTDIVIYPAQTHNYIFANSREFLVDTGAWIVHFKGGKRKELLPEYVDSLKARYGAQNVSRFEKRVVSV